MAMPPQFAKKPSPGRAASEAIVAHLGTIPGRMRAQAMRPPKPAPEESEVAEPDEGSPAEEAMDATEPEEKEPDGGPLRPDELADIRALLRKMKGGA
jgi:hypothetical protein